MLLNMFERLLPDIGWDIPFNDMPLGGIMIYGDLNPLRKINNFFHISYVAVKLVAAVVAPSVLRTCTP